MEIQQLKQELESIHKQIVASERTAEKLSRSVHAKYRLSAKNLYRYLVLRSLDLRLIHDQLSDLGISSLRTSEGYVYVSIYNALKIASLLAGGSWEKDMDVEAIGYQQSKELLRKHANNLFNEVIREEHFTEIMVTLPDEASEDAILRAL
jgi:pyruvate kinase